MTKDDHTLAHNKKRERFSVVRIFRIGDGGKFAERWDVCQMESDGQPEAGTLF